MKLDSLTCVQILQRHMPGGWFGEDRDGHPVWYDHIDLDCRGEGGGENRGGGDQEGGEREGIVEREGEGEERGEGGEREERLSVSVLLH